jgi:hypothetical protein
MWTGGSTTVVSNGSHVGLSETLIVKEERLIERGKELFQGGGAQRCTGAQLKACPESPDITGAIHQGQQQGQRVWHEDRCLAYAQRVG